MTPIFQWLRSLHAKQTPASYQQKLLQEAELLSIYHKAEAEQHDALAKMFAVRAQRLAAATKTPAQ